MASVDYDALKARLDAHGQGHCLAAWDSLDEKARSALAAELAALDLTYIDKVYKQSTTTDGPSGPPEPFNGVSRIADASDSQREFWRWSGLKLIAESKVGIILMSGGQGTRLGSDLPKGCYDILLPSHKSLFALQAERIVCLKRLAAATAGKDPSVVSLPWYIMTSEFTHEETKKHFEDHGHFGLPAADVIFFLQGTLPCVTEEGKLIMESASHLARAPDGNGGLYTALQDTGCLADMEKRGLEALDCYCVDNAIVRPGDPVFIGYCHEAKAECGARTIPKAYPEERVGVFAAAGGRVKVVEYSELDPALAAGSDKDGNLLFNWSNVCMHYFTPTFLKHVVNEMTHGEGSTGCMPYHVAKKQIPSVGGPVPGIKFEMFIFDSFPLVANPALFEVRRDEEFAPVKNAPGSARDCPETARSMLFQLHKKWIEAAGGTIEGEVGDTGVEISPLLSYAGEGLTEYVADKTFTAPWIIDYAPKSPWEAIVEKIQQFFAMLFPPAAASGSS